MRTSTRKHRNNKRHMLKLVITGAAAALLWVTSAQAAAPLNFGILATDDQNIVELLALKIIKMPEMEKAFAESHKALLAHPAAQTKEGRQTSRQAVEDMAYFSALAAAIAGDPAHPKIAWMICAPHVLFGHHAPGSRFALDNPDNAYRITAIDGAAKYEISVRVPKSGPAQFSFLLYDTFMGEDTRMGGGLDKPLGGLRDQDIQREADGSFKITIDAEPANGRVNHIQSKPEARMLLMRNTLADWRTQLPLDMTIRRVDAVTVVKAQTNAEMDKHAAAILKGGTTALLRFISEGNKPGQLGTEGLADAEPNVLSTLWARGGGWGFANHATYKLADDEAWVITLDPLGAKYLGFVVATPWTVSREHIRANGSLNNRQARPNADGSTTYVIAPKDPGVFNWIDTDGLHEGKLMIRWQAVPLELTSTEGAVRESTVVKLANLAKSLPPNIEKVSPEQRKKLYAERALTYAHRYQPE